MNTSYFRYYNMNPKNRITQDCVIRALCLFLEKPYNEILADLIQIYNSTGFHIADPVCFMYYLKRLGNTQTYNVDFTKNLRLCDLCCYIDVQNHNDNMTQLPQNYMEFTNITHKNCDNVLVLLENTHLTFVQKSVILDVWDCSYLKIVSYFLRTD